MSALFSQTNLFLCGMQGNNGLLAKTLKKIQNHLYSQPVLTFDRCQICSASCQCLTNIIKNLLFLFSFLMASLCVIFKSVCTRRILSTPANDVHVNWKQPAKRLKLQERLLTINKRNIIRWNIYRDKNFHSRRQVLRLKCPWKSWVM